MTRSSLFLVSLPLLAYAEVSQAQAAAPLPFHGAGPEVLACAMITLAALALAGIGLRRSVVTDERARVLQQQLATEREARCQSDQALAANHDVLYRLVHQHEGVREGERARIGCQLQAELGRRLLSLRNEMASLHDTAHMTPALAARLDCALANLDGAIGAVRAVAGGLRGANPGDGLRQALERCLAEHAHCHGLRYRFEAGVDPSSRASQDRAARLAVFRVLQDVLAGATGKPDAHPGNEQESELYVRLIEGAASLGLEIDGCAASVDAMSALPAELVDHIRALGGVLRMVATAERRARWSLLVPVRTPAAGIPGIMAELA